MPCRGLCRQHPNYIPLKKIDYSKGMKVCIFCDRAVFMKIESAKCPCCTKNLRTKPQYHGAKGRLIRRQMQKATSC